MENFPRIDVRHQATDSGISENIKSRINAKRKEKLHLGISYFNCIKSKVAKKILKEAGGRVGGSTLPIKEQSKELHLTSLQTPYKQEESGVKYLKC